MSDNDLPHHCEICETDFETADETFDHDCDGTDGPQSLQGHVLQAIDDHAEPEDGGAPVGIVIDAVLRRERAGVGAVCSAVQDLHARGEIYQPTFNTVRRIKMQPTEGDDGR